jgi:hypothetical protein
MYEPAILWEQLAIRNQQADCAFRPTGSAQQPAEEYRRRFPLMTADQEELAANSANEHESRTQEMIRVFRVNSWLVFLANCQLLIASFFGCLLTAVC